MYSRKMFLWMLCILLFGVSVLYGQILQRDNTLPTGPMTFMEEEGDPYQVFMSTRTNHTLHNNHYFYVYDRDISRISKKNGHAHLTFKGLPYNILTLDAADFVFSIRSPDETTPPEIDALYFSVSESQSITKLDGTTFYAKQNDVVCMESCGCMNVVFPGIYYNCPGVDGVSVISGYPGDEFKKKILISPTEDWYCTECGPDLHFKDEDIACYDPESGEISVFFRGSDIGIHTLDAFDFVEAMYDSPPEESELFFSVRCPEYLDQVGNPVYLYDEDVAVLNWGPNSEVKHYILGNTHYLCDLDALSVDMDNPGCAFLPWGNVRDELDAGSEPNPTIK